MKFSVTTALFAAALISSATFADNDPNRDVTCAAAQIGVSEPGFRACFAPVQPATRQAANGG